MPGLISGIFSSIDWHDMNDMMSLWAYSIKIEVQYRTERKPNLPFIHTIQYNDKVSNVFYVLYFFLFESIAWTAYQTLWTNSAVSLSHLLVIIVTALDY